MKTSSASYKLDLPSLPKDLPTLGHVMPEFHHNLLEIGEFCDADCKVLFTKTSITIFDKKWSQSSQDGGTTTVPNYGTSPCYLMKMTPLCAINQKIPR